MIGKDERINTEFDLNRELERMKHEIQQNFETYSKELTEKYQKKVCDNWGYSFYSFPRLRENIKSSTNKEKKGIRSQMS